MSDLDPCPFCGKDGFGNAGARTQHVQACERKAEKYNNAPAPDEPQEAAPATPDSTTADGGAARAPARRDQNPTEDPQTLAQAGESMASGLSATLDEDAPLETRKDGVKNLTSLAGGLLNGVMDYRSRKSQREEQHARNVGLEEVEDKPECGNCGLTFSKIPENAERVSCPECGAEYRVV